MVREKKLFASRINPELLRRLKHLSVDTDKTVGQLLEEAVADLLAKYQEQAKRAEQQKH